MYVNVSIFFTVTIHNDIVSQILCIVKHFGRDSDTRGKSQITNNYKPGLLQI